MIKTKRYLFSVDESRLNVFSIQSGELVFKLSHHNLPIISICINPLNKFQLLSFHSDGKLCIWDYEDGLLLKVSSRFIYTILRGLFIFEWLTLKGHWNEPEREKSHLQESELVRYS